MKEKVYGFFAGMKRPNMKKRIPALFVSVIIMGLGIAIFNRLNFGTDPCSVLTLGLNRVVGIPYGTLLLMINTVLMLIVIRFDIRRIGIGTLANMIVVGYSAEFFMAVHDRFFALPQASVAVRLLVFVPTLIVFLIAAAIYLCVDMGVAPYDAVPQIICDRTHKPFRLVRTCWDCGTVLLGIIAGSTEAGLVTAGIALFFGPLVAWAARYIKPYFGD